MKEKFSLMLKSKRDEKKLTKKETARLMGVTPMYYARFENSDLLPTKRNIDFFSYFLNIDKDDLIKIIEDEKNNEF